MEAALTRKTPYTPKVTDHLFDKLYASRVTVTLGTVIDNAYEITHGASYPNLKSVRHAHARTGERP